ncbi:hypothetical protein [Altererythrobacter sp. MF3-039]|uniref:hypothetical protein n=1 Tax=Altererythrobacter sp. MF3-039 TaxID=3252901 RepID=UPI00390C4220
MLISKFLKDSRATSAAEYALTLGTLGFAVVLGNIAIKSSVEAAMTSETAAIAGPASSGDSSGSGGNSNGNGNGGGDAGGNGNGSGNCKPKKNC